MHNTNSSVIGWQSKNKMLNHKKKPRENEAFFMI